MAEENDDPIEVLKGHLSQMTLSQRAACERVIEMKSCPKCEEVKSIYGLTDVTLPELEKLKSDSAELMKLRSRIDEFIKRISAKGDKE